VAAIKEHREGKLTLRTYNVESTPLQTNKRPAGLGAYGPSFASLILVASSDRLALHPIDRFSGHYRNFVYR